MHLHPLIAHFPIVLLLVGVACDVVGMFNRRAFFFQTGYLLFALGAFSSIPVALTGDQAAELARHIDHIATDLDDHETLGTAATFLAVALVLIRAHFTAKKQFTGTIRYVYLAFALLTVGLVSAAGYTGGHLVYHYGAGTRPITSQIKAEKSIPQIDAFESQ